MTVDIFFLLGYFIVILIFWAIPYFRNFLESHKSELLTISSGYIFLLADVKSDDKTIVMFGKNWEELNTFLIVVGLVLAFISIVLSYYEKQKQQSFETITTELASTKTKLKKIQEEYKELCSENIKEIFSDFLSTSNGNGRVSLYKHEGTNFKLLGRYSNNPIYNKEGQETYSDSEGFIAKGWQNNRFEVHSIPNWSGKGAQYKSHVKALCNITDERLKKLTMKSRSFFIYRFNNNHNAGNPHGIIVFEKMNDSQIQTALIDAIFQNHEAQIISLLKNMKSLY
ncbi:hypothetical protein [Flavobacterium phragmitis]|uniref:Uncharacterized protein n=1 Tax=Flavobacterium phragmitis TaxID=739143 RepID=A0A1I1LGD0_9FLAO|nr:hypothetical protein [Flavobacterium phragmitis]SFC72154.1 hypothetical protein SAMN05216297_10210 [Flavobacterium phragmitis]